jgi:pyruvate dehydrogenase E1 component
VSDTSVDYREHLARKILWLSCWMIDQANRGEKIDGVKVGGHQASSASLVSVMTALYFNALRGSDRVAVKPHASPVFHAIQYLAGNQTLDKLKNFRGFGGAQSYPSRTKDSDDVDFSTGSVGLGAGITVFASLVQDFVRARGWGRGSEGRMVALVGDAELDEGNVYEALQEAWKHGLRNCWWIIDYNRQSLDGVVQEGLHQRIETVFRAFGWNVVTMKYGHHQRAAFERPGGAALRDWIDTCPNQHYSALTFQGGTAWRQRLLDDLGDQGMVSALIGSYGDAALATLMGNLGGHCQRTLDAGFASVTGDAPTAFMAYTVKGWGTPLAGHKDNHAGLMTQAQMDAFRQSLGIRPGHEWDMFEGIDLPEAALRRYIEETPFFAGRTPCDAPPLAVPAGLIETPARPFETVSTQMAFGRILEGIARSEDPIADRILTTSPDVTVSTNLGPWVNRRKLFSRTEQRDVFKDSGIPSTQRWNADPGGQHLELGIAEMNLFLLLGAAGLAHSLFGARLLPIGTLYDPFISRGLDALNYACYQDARFILVGTPSGISLAGEGGAHQSIATPLIGMSQDRLAAFEPAFADELAVIFQWALEHMQRDDDGGSVYLRLSTRQIEQPVRRDNGDFAQEVIAGGTWLREPGPNAEIVIAYQGTIATEALSAAGLVGDARRDIGVLAVTSADRLYRGWQAAQAARRDGTATLSHIEHLLGRLPPTCRLLTVIDGHPATLSWLGGVAGHRTTSLGVERFGQCGTVTDLYRHYGIDAAAIADRALRFTSGVHA